MADTRRSIQESRPDGGVTTGQGGDDQKKEDEQSFNSDNAHQNNNNTSDANNQTEPTGGSNGRIDYNYSQAYIANNTNSATPVSAASPVPVSTTPRVASGKGGNDLAQTPPDGNPAGNPADSTANDNKKPPSANPFSPTGASRINQDSVASRNFDYKRKDLTNLSTFIHLMTPAYDALKRGGSVAYNAREPAFWDADIYIGDRLLARQRVSNYATDFTVGFFDQLWNDGTTIGSFYMPSPVLPKRDPISDLINNLDGRSVNPSGIKDDYRPSTPDINLNEIAEKYFSNSLSGINTLFTGPGEEAGQTLAKIGEAALLSKVPGWARRSFATKTIIEGSSKAAEDFVGILKGEKVQLPGVKTEVINYTKRNPAEAAELRKVFNSTGRKDFLQQLSTDTENLKRAGFSDVDIARIERGLTPRGWEVHHIFPLDAEGTNAMDNLVLIKNDPFHKVITNYQNTFTKDLLPGDTLNIEWPILEGNIYPPEIK